MTTARRQTGLAGRLTARAWMQWVLALMSSVVVIGAIAGAQVIAETNHVTDRLVNQTQPAATEAYRLQSALVNQETGLRGYAIAGDRQFLAPYTDGKQDEARAAARIRELLADRPALRADLDAVERAARQWRDGYAEPLVAAGTSGGFRTMDAVGGKEIFDEVRRLLDTQNGDIAAAIDGDRDELARMRDTRNAVLVGMVVVFLFAGLVLTVLVRRLVVEPLGYLESASLRVAQGDFDHRITVRGPADLATVAAAVESMRRRIVAELASSRAKEAMLGEQAADLDAQTAELRRSNAELEQFAYVASHDLQEPLRKVASFCQLLEKRYGDKLDERGRQYIDFAVDGAKRMQVLINDLLTFSRVGRVNDRSVPTDLGQTLDKALANLASAIEDTGARVERPDELPEVTGDPLLLTMLWQNLIGNAIKFRRPDEAPVLRLTCAAQESGGWLLSLSDNGIGIAPEFAEKVFVIFQRLHSRDEYSGTGIGLALCKKIVEYHGGRIWIDADYTEGTRFWLTLNPSAGEDARGAAAAKAMASLPGEGAVARVPGSESAPAGKETAAAAPVAEHGTGNTATRTTPTSSGS